MGQTLAGKQLKGLHKPQFGGGEAGVASRAESCLVRQIRPTGWWEVPHIETQSDNVGSFGLFAIVSIAKLPVLGLTAAQPGVQLIPIEHTARELAPW
jgi:hypothetical protein